MDREPGSAAGARVWAGLEGTGKGGVNAEVEPWTVRVVVMTDRGGERTEGGAAADSRLFIRNLFLIFCVGGNAKKVPGSYIFFALVLVIKLIQVKKNIKLIFYQVLAYIFLYYKLGTSIDICLV